MGELGISAGRAALVWIVPLTMILLMIWFERKIAAYVQDRTGPNRADVLGIRLGGFVHNFSDVIKLIFKEDITPAGVHKFYFMLAPFIAMLVALMTFAVVPFADTLRIGSHIIPMQALKLNVGVLWVFAISSFGVFGIIFAGYGANNKYAILGGIRSSAQMISYELALSLSIVGLLMIYGTLDLNSMVQQQGKLLFGFIPMWGVVVQPVAAILFLTCILAETNRTPFDLPEAESEIVGFHVEYSSLKFALFFMSEYVNIVVISAVAVSLFFGGWQVPWLTTETLIANAQTVMLVLLGSVAVVSLLLVLAARRWNRTLQRLYPNDMRRHEANFWSIILSLKIIACIVGFVILLANPVSGWGPPVIAAAVQFAAFMAKVVFFGFAFVWVRWTLPRFRYDQLMGLGWKGMLPLSLLNLFVTALVILIFKL